MQEASRLFMVKEPLHLATSYRKLRNIWVPFSDRSTSGWNWTPYNFCFSLEMAATGGQRGQRGHQQGVRGVRGVRGVTNRGSEGSEGSEGSPTGGQRGQRGQRGN